MNLNQAKKKYINTWWLIPNTPEYNKYRDAGVYHITAVHNEYANNVDEETFLIELIAYPDRNDYKVAPDEEGGFGYQDDTLNFFGDNPEPLTYEQALMHIM